MPATTKPTADWPIYRALLYVACAPVLPQMLGSFFNIWYNKSVIVPLLNNPVLHERFMETVLFYNAGAYPIAVIIWARLIHSLVPALREVWFHDTPTETLQLKRARRRVINLPWWGALLAGISWLLCIPVFLGALLATGQPLNPTLFIHLPISFVVSALISITHSFFLIEMSTHRLLLPILFRHSPAHAVPGTWKLNVRGRGLLWVISAAICPISSLLLLSFAPVNPSSNPQGFALFVGFIGIGFGIFTALMMGHLVAEPIDLLSNAVRDVAAGRFDTQMTLRRPDEFGLLISEFNRMIRELREKEHLRETFGLHVGRNAAERILAHDPKLAGAEENITVMFCDIRNYTARCARQAPDRTVRFLNAFFGVMVRIIEENHGGMINQFTGDGFMALFGAYGSPEHHADAALQAARDMLAAQTDFNANLLEPDFEPLAFGIGLHTGRAVVGSVGSPRRMTFTAIGSTVNIASRVESLTKILGHPLVLTQATRDALVHAPLLEQLPAQQVKGVDQPLTIYTPK